LTVDTIDDYVSDIKEFILRNLSSSIDSIEQKKIFVMMNCRLPHIWDVIIKDRSNKEFVNSLVDQAANMPLVNSVQHPLVAILNGMTEIVDRGLWKEISELKLRVINSQQKLEQAYVALLVDLDFANYIPLDSSELKRHSLMTDGNIRLTFNAISNRINELGSKKYWRRTQYPFFNIDPWIHCSCEEVNRFSRIVRHFDQERFLAILVDVSIFERPCCSNVEEILSIAIAKPRIGIACIMNCAVSTPKIPPLIEQNRYFEANLTTIDAIVDFLWEKYDAWQINKKRGGSVVVKTAGA
jgi:hypothetical protein